MRNLLRNAVIVVVVVVIAIWSIIPPEKNLRLGRDLAGGVSLVYAVDVGPNEDAGATLSAVIGVLKERVDPTGLLEIAMVAQGNDRIEISMPLPSDLVKRLRAEFEERLREVTGPRLTEQDVRALVELPEPRRSERADELAAGDVARRQLLARLAAAHDARTAARAAYATAQEKADAATANLERARAEPVPDPRFVELNELAFRQASTAADQAAFDAARAEDEFDRALAESRSIAVSETELRRALSLSDEAERLRDTQTGEVVELPSPRREALDRIRTQHPDAAARIDAVIAAWDRYQQERRTLDDPQDLVRLLRGAGVLNFRIAVRSSSAEVPGLRTAFRKDGPRGQRLDRHGWYKINKIANWYDNVQGLRRLRELGGADFFAEMDFVVEEWDGQYYMLLHDSPGLRLTEGDGEWRLTGASVSRDDYGRPAISFTLDQLGGRRMGELTENNLGQAMAVLLDDEVYTAPTLQGRITTSGQISGVFSQPELDYIIRVLSAGSLQAKLSPEPISQSVLGPSLGADNLQKGLNAAIVSFVVVSSFMILYYFGAGSIAVVALIFNAILLVGIMALQRAAFTLPGIAGIALTFGQAVDANVLVYERMREELGAGSDMRTAVRLGHERAMSSIVDGNVTNLIVCVVLGFMGTQEIKGFAITLGVGVLTTLFMQLFATRVIFELLTVHGGWRRARMLPIVWKGLGRALVPNVDWMRLRYVGYAVSIGLTLASVAVIAARGSDLLDAEFRGGTSVTLELRDPATGVPVTLTRAQVEERVERLAAEDRSGRLGELADAEVVVVDPDETGFTSDRFTIKTVVADPEVVLAAIAPQFADVMQVRPALRFAESETTTLGALPAWPVLAPRLGEVIDRPDVATDVGAYQGGIVFVIRDLEPPASVAAIESRLTQMRGHQQFSDTVTREQRVVLLDGTSDQARSVAVLVRDPELSYERDEQRWTAELKSREWGLIRAALTEASTPASVQSFSAAIARTFKAQAIISIILSTLLVVIYVWVRFNSLRFSLAAIITTLHDCIVAVGAVALAGVLYHRFPGVASALHLRPFKFDLALVAAVLTILGYSLNDTIIIMDRIRENRGKLPYATREVINRSINQTLSRTMITSGTTIISVVVLYILGGEAIREFAFALFVGILVGTYSSVAVAAPMVWSHRRESDPDDAGVAPATGGYAGLDGAATGIRTVGGAV